MKIIVLNGIKFALTPERLHRIFSAIDETQRHLEKELSISEEFQKKETIDFCRGHIAKLVTALDEAEEVL